VDDLVVDIKIFVFDDPVVVSVEIKFETIIYKIKCNL
jgi:hypothetical protein